MLTVKKSISLSGICTINGTKIERYDASIDTENLNATTITQRQLDISLCEEYKEKCRQDSAEFEDIVYQMIDDMAAEDAKKGED